MAETFNPYHEWLGIPSNELPADYYRLLGIPAFEGSPSVIEHAADRQMAHLRTFQAGPHSAASQRLLNEVAAARVCLLNPAKKTAYDEQLRQRRGVSVGKGEGPVDPPMAGSTLKQGSRLLGNRHVPWITAGALGVVVIGAAVWWSMGRGDTADDGAVAQAGALDAQGPVGPPPDSSPKEPETNAVPAPAVAAKQDSDLETVATDPPADAPSEPAMPRGENEAKPHLPTPAIGQAPPAPSEVRAEGPKVKEGSEERPGRPFDPPPAQEQKRLSGTIDEVYNVAQAKDAAAKTALARKLLADGQGNEANRAEQFVMFRRAGELARDAGEPGLTLEAVDALVAAGFRIRPWEAKTLWLRQTIEGRPGDDSALPAIATSCVEFAEAAAAGDATDEAMEILDAVRRSLSEPKRRMQQASRAARAAVSHARNLPDKAARESKAKEADDKLASIDAVLTAAAQCAQGIQQARRQREAVQSAEERLKTAPGDPEACLVVGTWLCFEKGQWEAGLKLLAHASNEALKSLATAELGPNPSSAEGRVARGDAWWDLAERAGDRAKKAMRHRAGHWYQQALPDLAGLTRVKVEGRLAEVSQDPPSETTPAETAPPPAVAPFNEKVAKLYQARWARHLRMPAIQANSIGMRLALVPPGEFEMGSTKEFVDEEMRLHGGEQWYGGVLPGETPRHKVQITRPYWMGVTEVTQEEFLRVMGNNPSKFLGEPKRPAERVTWTEATEFCRRLSELPAEKAAKRQYVLPTEAQWEHACRAGNPGVWSSSPQPAPAHQAAEEKLLSQYAWFMANSGAQTHPVGQLRANPWSLHDMHGNVWEWCADWYYEIYYDRSPLEDPPGPDGGRGHVIRGGGWNGPAWQSRSAIRGSRSSSQRMIHLGFRVAVPSAPTQDPR